MKARVLKNKRRKKASKGRVIRVSDEVYKFLNARRLNRTSQSWDQYLRKFLALPDRAGNEQPILEGWIEKRTGKFYLSEAEAAGAAVVEMAKARTKKYLAPIYVREIP